jgi:hypothetical protein
MRTAFIVLGVFAEMAAWWLVSVKGRDVWKLMPLVLVVLGVAAVLGARAREPEVDRTVALAAGAGAGVALYLATRVFLRLALRWEPFRRHTGDVYGRASGTPMLRALTLSLGAMVPAEELFWRGLAQGELARGSLGSVGGALVAWALYVVANLPSRSLPIIAGAAAGGAAWGALAWWTGGILAPLTSHILWTGLMLVRPPSEVR